MCCAEFLRHLEFGFGDVDSDHVGAGESRVLDGQMAVLGETAVDPVAGVHLRLAERLPAVDAELAATASRSEPRHSDAIADFDVVDGVTKRVDDADALVVGNESLGGFRRCRVQCHVS